MPFLQEQRKHLQAVLIWEGQLPFARSSTRQTITSILIVNRVGNKAEFEQK